MESGGPGNEGRMTQTSRHEIRHEGTPFEPVPREAMSGGYPPEADPAPDDDSTPDEVPGEQVDPDRRLEQFPEDDEDADGSSAGSSDSPTAPQDPGTPDETVVPGSEEPPD